MIPLLLLLAIVLAACTGAVGLVDPGPEPDDTSPSAAAINAAANKATEQTTVTSETTGSAKVLADAAEITASEPLATAEPDKPLPAKSPQINRRVEVPDNLRVNWLIPWDGIRPIYDPEFVPADNAPLQDGELIIGVAWDGEAKAYPISVLRSREMVNDELAGIPTLVTW